MLVISLVSWLLFSTSFLCRTSLRLAMVCSLRNLAALSRSFYMLPVTCSGCSLTNLSFTRFISNPLPRFLFSLLICTNITFISVVHSRYIFGLCVSFLLIESSCTLPHPSANEVYNLLLKHTTLN